MYVIFSRTSYYLYNRESDLYSWPGGSTRIAPKIIEMLNTNHWDNVGTQSAGIMSDLEWCFEIPGFDYLKCKVMFVSTEIFTVATVVYGSCPDNGNGFPLFRVPYL